MSTKPSQERETTRNSEQSAPNDALELLHADHQQVEDLFSKFEKARGGDRKERIAAQICAELKAHTQIEEEIFYPAARKALKDGDLLDEALVEHGSAKALIEQIESADADEPLFDAKVKVLSEYIKHHVSEEENELFPKLRKADIDLVALCDTLTEAKSALVAQS
jgi:hemerythrin superfamily protein